MNLLRKPVLVLAPAAALVVAITMFTNVLPFRQIYEQRQEVATAQSRLEQLVEANASLEAQVGALESPLEIERLAREHLGYVRPGESAFVVIDPPDTEPVYAEDFGLQAVPETPVVERVWYLRVWDFLTGRDLAAGV